MISFELHGEPFGWQRTGIRVVAPRGGRPFAQIYVKPETRAYEKALGLAAKVAMGSRPLLTGALRLRVTAFMGVPGSWSIRKRDQALAGAIRPTVKPDWDNTGGMTDALNKIVWSDDAQVVDGRVLKFYDERPRLRVEVCEIELFSPELSAPLESDSDSR